MKNIKDLIVHEKYPKKEKKRNYSSASIKQFKDSLNLSTSKQFFLSVSSSNIDGYFCFYWGSMNERSCIMKN